MTIKHFFLVSDIANLEPTERGFRLKVERIGDFMSRWLDNLHLLYFSNN